MATLVSPLEITRRVHALKRICRERLDVINVLDAEVKRLSASKRTVN